MGKNSKIEWTNDTWNPILGCTRVSEGCRNCYAETIAGRFSEGSNPAYKGLTKIVNGHATWTGKINTTNQLLQPLKWKEPRRVFVNSMSDLFHENVPNWLRDKIFAVMALSPQHTFQVLTKRPEAMLKYLSNEIRDGGVTAGFIAEAYGRPARFFPQMLKKLPLNQDVRQMKWPLPNVWLGVSCENQKAADERIPLLLEVPAAIRFVSAEPLLGPLDLRPWLGTQCVHDASYHEEDTGALICKKCDDSNLIDWVIVGGESGPHARPMLSHWADAIREQCKEANAKFFFKQNGEWIDAGHAEFGGLPSGKIKRLRSDGSVWDEGELPTSEDADVNTVKRVGKKRAGNTLYGKIYQQFPGE